MCGHLSLEAKRGHWIPWSWCYRQLRATNMGVGNWTWVCWKGSSPSSHLSSLWLGNVERKWKRSDFQVVKHWRSRRKAPSSGPGKINLASKIKHAYNKGVFRWNYSREWMNTEVHSLVLLSKASHNYSDDSDWLLMWQWATVNAEKWRATVPI